MASVDIYVFVGDRATNLGIRNAQIHGVKSYGVSAYHYSNGWYKVWNVNWEWVHPGKWVARLALRRRDISLATSTSNLTISTSTST
jgi:hypothetical protein